MILSKLVPFLSNPLFAVTMSISTAALVWAPAAEAQSQPFSINCKPATGPSQVGVAYSATCAGSGGTLPYRWSISGSLPPGLGWSASETAAVISGTPKVAGDYGYVVQATDNSSKPQIASQSYKGTITTPVQLSCDPPTGPTTLGVPYSATCVMSGGRGPYSWSIIGSPPAGLILSPSENYAKITVTPKVTGGYSYTVQAIDNGTGQVGTYSFSGAIIGPLALTCSPSTGPTTLATAYGAKCGATGGNAPYFWLISAGSLPAGLTLNASGSSASITGTPTATGNYSYTVEVRDSDIGGAPQRAWQVYSGTITAPTVPISLKCDPSTGPTMVGTAYAASCSVSGGTAPYSWTITQGSLPTGVTLQASQSSATISGNPTDAGNYSYTVRVTDSGTQIQSATQAYSGTIIGPISLTCNPSGGPLVVGTSYTATCSVSGGASPYSFSVSQGSLPTGIVLNSSGPNATITGTPTASGAYSYSIRVTDSAAVPQVATLAYRGIITGLISLTCDPAAGPTIAGAAYTATCTVSGGASPYDWSINPGLLPAGLTLSASGNNATVSGTPATVGTYSYAVMVTDSSASPQAATQAYNGAISAPVLPAITIALQPSMMPTQPVDVGLQLSAPAPAELQGTLSLTFRALAPGLPDGYADPALQFTSGGRILNFTIPAGATSVALPNWTIQQGTVAGDITVLLVSLRLDTTDVTPQPPPSRTISIPILPPVITANSVHIVNVTANSFEVEFTAYSTPRDLIEARYTFDVISGTQIVGSATVAVDVRSPANEWYSSGQSQTYGSLFMLRIRFTVEGDPNSIASVAVTLSNSAGTSAAVMGRRNASF